MGDRGRVAVFGDATLDFLVRLPERTAGIHDEKVFAIDSSAHAGGTGMNVAVGVHSLGVDTLFFTALGNDAAGRWLRDEIARLALLHHEIREQAEPTPIAHIIIRGEERELIISASGSLRATPVESPVLLQACDVIYVTQSTASLEYLIDAGLGSKIVLGFEGWMADLPQFKKWLSRCRVGITNEAGMDVLRLNGAHDIEAPVVETRGARGSVIHHPRTPAAIVEPYAASTVDATGAGDAYAATLVAELACGTPLEDAARTASVAGALTTTGYGPRVPLPSIQVMRELRQRLA